MWHTPAASLSLLSFLYGQKESKFYLFFWLVVTLPVGWAYQQPVFSSLEFFSHCTKHLINFGPSMQLVSSGFREKM